MDGLVEFAVSAGALDGDSWDDLLAVRESTGDLYFYRGLGSGYFAMKVKVGNGWSGFDIASGADLDGDGRGDVVGRDSQGRLFFYRGLVNGRLATKTQIGNGWGAPGAQPDPAITTPGAMDKLTWEIPSQEPVVPMGTTAG
jgi:hypothetical protein